MDVIAYDIKQNPAVEAMGIPYTSMDEALQQADVVSVHVPLLKSTHHFINQERWVLEEAAVGNSGRHAMQIELHACSALVSALFTCRK